MKTAISSSIILLILVFNMDSFSQSGWTKQRSLTDSRLNALHFINDNTGWVVGDGGVICKTTNGGTNWTSSFYSLGGTLVSLFYKNQNSGIVGGYNVSHLSGFIIKTTNNGANWSRLNFTGEPYDIFSLGGDTVWSSRHDGTVMKTTDFGGTWTPTFVHQNLELYTVYFVNNLTGWTGGAVYGGLAYIYKTTNGGISWFNQFIHATNHFFSIYFVNQLTGFASTLYGCIYGTTNGGTDWSLKLNGITNYLYNVVFPNVNTGYAVGGFRTIIKSTSSGANWNLQVLPSDITSFITFSSVLFRNTLLGWAIGDSGIIIKTTNGGEPIGIRPIGNIVPGSFNLYQNYPNPFNPSTTIEFDIPKSSFTNIVVYDNKGEEVMTLVNEHLHTGKYKVDFHAYELSSGTYYYRLTTGEFTQTRKLVLLK